MIYPLSIGILLIIISYIFYRNKKIKFFQPLLIVGLIIIYLPSITPIQRILFKSIHVSSFKISDLNQIDAIVVLGGEPARSISGIRLYNKNIRKDIRIKLLNKISKQNIKNHIKM